MDEEEETIDFFELIDQQYEELVQERLNNGYYKNK